MLSSAVDYPVLADFVTDNAGMISPEYERAIAQLTKQIEQNTTVEIAVVTVESLEGVPIDQYAIELFEKNGIGKKDRDNGLLILIAKQERKYRVEVGYGLEGSVPDAHKADIGAGIMEPNFKAGNFGKGVYEAVLAINGLINNDPDVMSEYKSKYYTTQPSQPGIPFDIIIFLLLFIILPLLTRGRRGFIWFPLFLGGSRRRGGFSGGMGGFGGTGFGGFGGGFSGGGGFGGSW